MESNKTKIIITLESGEEVDAISLTYSHDPNGFALDCVNSNAFNIPYRYSCGILLAHNPITELDKISYIDVFSSHGTSYTFSDILVSHVGLSTISLYAKNKVPIIVFNHKSNTNHNEGKIYNPYTDTWSWI